MRARRRAGVPWIDAWNPMRPMHRAAGLPGRAWVVRKWFANAGSAVRHGYHPVTLSFFDPETERRFQDQYARITVIPSRIAHLLGFSLYILFGFVDPFIVPEVKWEVWGIRFVVCALTLASLATTFTRLFYAHHQAVLMALASIFGISILLMLVLADESAMNRYYPGLILVLIGTFNTLGIRFLNALAISAGVLFLYCMLEWGFKANEAHLIATNLMFLSGTAIICGAASYTSERHLRRLFRYQVILEGMYSESQEESARDSLTNLLNRGGWEDLARHSLARAQRGGAMAAVIFVDLDGFKPINDEHGHEVGDRVLNNVAHRIVASVRKSDSVGRFGGDEFVILSADLSSIDDVTAVTERILASLSERFQVAGMECGLGASIGVSIYPWDGKTVDELVRAADRAMYTVKRSGQSGIRFFSAPSAIGDRQARMDG